MSLLEPVTLCFPDLPRGLEGLRIAHLTDLHVRRFTRFHERLIASLRTSRVDLAVYTGDYQFGDDTDPGAVRDVMGRVLEAMPTRFGSFGVWGNHDLEATRRHLDDLPIRWLVNERVRVGDRHLELWGVNFGRPGGIDSIATALSPIESDERGDRESNGKSPRPFRCMLVHLPTLFPCAADLGMDLALAGHTHGGQVRLPGRRAIVNSTDLPLRLTAGVMRHRQMVGVVSRGVGTVTIPLRVFCPPHIPIYTLRRGPLPGQSVETTTNLRRW